MGWPPVRTGGWRLPGSYHVIDFNDAIDGCGLVVELTRQTSPRGDVELVHPNELVRSGGPATSVFPVAPLSLLVFLSHGIW